MTEMPRPEGVLLRVSKDENTLLMVRDARLRLAPYHEVIFSG
jgi:hypothetical protein